MSLPPLWRYTAVGTGGGDGGFNQAGPLVHPPRSQVTLAQPSGSIWSGQCSQQCLPRQPHAPAQTLPHLPAGVRPGVCSPHQARKRGHCTPARPPPPPLLLSAWHCDQARPLLDSLCPGLALLQGKASSLSATSHLSDHLDLTALPGPAQGRHLRKLSLIPLSPAG